jgi:ribose transport system permease protein
VEPDVTLAESPEKVAEPTTSGRRVPAAILALVGVLVALILANGLVDVAFFSLGQLRNTLLLAAPLALFAGAQTLCMLTGGIDLSVTMTATAVAYVVGSRAAAGDSTVTALLLGLVVALVVGLINGLAIGVFGVNPLIMTLGMAAILTGVLTVGSQSFLGGATRMPQIVLTLGRGTFLGPLPWNLLVWAVLAVLLVLLLRRTGLGRLIYAIGDNRRAARLAGVRVWQVETAVYVIAAVLGAVAGILIGGRSGAVDLQLAGSYLLPSIAAAVIGGTSILGGVGGYGGTVLGALILTVLDTMLTRLAVGESLRQLVQGGILLALAWVYVSSTRRASARRRSG